MKKPMTRPWPGLVAAFLMAAAVGCSQDRAPSSTSPKAAQQSSRDSRAEGKVEVKPLRLAEFENLIKELKGKVVVVDFWMDS